jgi:hypothetical protein
MTRINEKDNGAARSRAPSNQAKRHHELLSVAPITMRTRYVLIIYQSR